MRRLFPLLLAACAGPGDPAELPPELKKTEPERAVEVRPAGVFRPFIEAAVVPPKPLTVEFLGVGGFLITRGDEQVMTPPLFTRPSLIAVNTGQEARSDVTAISARFPTARVKGLKAIFSGHAHYDHLIDAPAAQRNAPKPWLYGNASMKNLLSALSPSRPAGCPARGPTEVTLEPERVVAFDAPGASTVDYRLCPAQKPAGAPLEGTWVRVPNSHIRVMALCSEHPDQFGPIHFAPGDVEQPQCELPARPDAWKEGRTLSYLIDFLDPATDAPTMRVYYQDSPGNDPVGYAPPELLAQKRVDIALLCVGSYNQVPREEPTRTLGAMAPRFALGHHWEDFFRPFEASPTPIPFVDVQTWGNRARGAMAGYDARPLIRNGQPVPERALVPMPNDVFVVEPAD